MLHFCRLSKNGTVAAHAYQSDILKSQIWTLREVPQPQLNPKEKLKLERYARSLAAAVVSRSYFVLKG